MGRVFLRLLIGLWGCACAPDTIAGGFLDSHQASNLLTMLRRAGQGLVEKIDHVLWGIFQTIVVVLLVLPDVPLRTVDR